VRRLAPPLLLLVLTLLAYGNTLDSEWHLDDYTYILEDGATGDLGARLRGLAADNRGVGRLTFTLNALAGGFDPRGFHVVNLAVHLACAGLVFLFARALLGAPRLAGALPEGEREPLAWGVALVFATHPLQVEAVTYVVQRWTALAAVFYLAASLAMLAHLRSGGRRAYALAILLALAALRTKEFAVTLPIAFVAYGALLFPRPTGPRERRALLLPLLLLLVIPATNYLFPHYNATEATRLADTVRETSLISPWSYLLTQFGVVLTYLRLALWPAGLNIDHDVRLVRSLADPAALVPLAALAAIAGAVFLLRRRAPLALAGLAFFALTIAPESSVLPITDLMFEHRMYLPLVGVLLAVAGLLRAVPALARPGRVPALLAILAIPLAAATRARNEVWRTEIALWADAAAKSPAKARPLQSLGIAYTRAGRLAEAEAALRGAIERDTSFADPYVNLAKVLERSGRGEDVEALYREAIARCPRHYMVHNNLGLLLADRLDDAGAEAEYREAIAENPRYALPHFNLGNLRAREERAAEAQACYQEALQRDPYLHAARVNLGSLLAMYGDLERARAEWRAVLRVDPRNASARENLERAERFGGEPPADGLRR
jgi:Tfp pilus assembly protein PilF